MMQLRILAGAFGFSAVAFWGRILPLDAQLILIVGLIAFGLFCIIAYAVLCVEMERLITQVRRRGLLSYLPDSVGTMLTRTTLHDFMSDTTWWNENRYMMIYFLGLDATQLEAAVAQLPRRRRDMVHRPGIGWMLPEAVQNVLLPSPTYHINGSLSSRLLSGASPMPMPMPVLMRDDDSASASAQHVQVQGYNNRDGQRRRPRHITARGAVEGLLAMLISPFVLESSSSSPSSPPDNNNIVAAANEIAVDEFDLDDDIGQNRTAASSVANTRRSQAVATYSRAEEEVTHLPTITSQTVTRTLYPPDGDDDDDGDSSMDLGIDLGGDELGGLSEEHVRTIAGTIGLRVGIGPAAHHATAGQEELIEAEALAAAQSWLLGVSETQTLGVDGTRTLDEDGDTDDDDSVTAEEEYAQDSQVITDAISSVVSSMAASATSTALDAIVGVMDSVSPAVTGAGVGSIIGMGVIYMQPLLIRRSVGGSSSTTSQHNSIMIGFAVSAVSAGSFFFVRSRMKSSISKLKKC